MNCYYTQQTLHYECENISSQYLSCNYSFMDCKETVKCIFFLLHPYKYINIIMFTLLHQSKYFCGIMYCPTLELLVFRTKDSLVVLFSYYGGTHLSVERNDK